MDSPKVNALIRLSTLAEKTGLSVHCIRMYVDQSLIQVSDRTSGGLLLFDETAIQRLRFIKTLGGCPRIESAVGLSILGQPPRDAGVNYPLIIE